METLIRKNKSESIEALVRQTIASVSWSHKIQRKQADIYSDRYNFLNVINIIASALTSAGILTVIFADGIWLKVGSAILSFVVTAISAFFKTVNLSSLEKEHIKSSNELWAVRSKLLVLLIEIGVEEKEYRELMTEYEAIQEELKDVYAKAPSTTKKAVKLAKKALKKDKDDTYTDEEIDCFLPPMCRKTTSGI